MKQKKDVALWRRHLAYVGGYAEDSEAELELPARRAHAAAELERVSSSAYLESLVGTLGTDPTAEN
jgi:hypothetical protein